MLLRGVPAQLEPRQPLMRRKLRCGISWTGRRGAHRPCPPRPDPLSSPRLSVPGLAPLSPLEVTIGSTGAPATYPRLSWTPATAGCMPSSGNPQTRRPLQGEHGLAEGPPASSCWAAPSREGGRESPGPMGTPLGTQGLILVNRAAGPSELSGAGGPGLGGLPPCPAPGGQPHLIRFSLAHR